MRIFKPKAIRSANLARAKLTKSKKLSWTGLIEFSHEFNHPQFSNDFRTDVAHQLVVDHVVEQLETAINGFNREHKILVNEVLGRSFSGNTKSDLKKRANAARKLYRLPDKGTYIFAGIKQSLKILSEEEKQTREHLDNDMFSTVIAGHLKTFKKAKDFGGMIEILELERT